MNMGYRWNKKFLLLMLLLLVLILSACSPIDSSAAKSYGIDVEWYVTFSGKNGEGNYVDLTSDGGYIVTGSRGSQAEIWLIKNDADGKLLWDKTFGGEGEDAGYYVQQTTDGGYILVGETYSFSTYYRPDALLIKTDADGNELWSKLFGSEDPDIGYHVQQTADGGYILVGETNPNAISPESIGGEADVLMVKTDADGNELWNKRFGGKGEDIGYCVQQTNDGGYVIAGTTESYSEDENPVAWLIKTDANGDEMWSKVYNDFSCLTYNVIGKSFIQQTSDNGYIISGSLKREDSYDSDGFVMKTDTEGNYLWHITFGGSKGGYASCVRETADGDYIVTGYIARRPPFWDIMSIDAYSFTDCVLLKIGG
jgi:hypothetical protein